MPELGQSATAWLALAGAIGLLVGLVGLVAGLLGVRAARRLKLRMDRLMRGGQVTDLEALLHEQWQVLRTAEDGVAVAKARLERAEETLSRCVQNVGLVRYNAFPGAGAELSFSLALLDSARDGVVLSGLYGREETRIYAKPIASGASRYPLSDEEREAIRAAGGVHVG